MPLNIITPSGLTSASWECPTLGQMHRCPGSVLSEWAAGPEAQAVAMKQQAPEKQELCCDSSSCWDTGDPSGLASSNPCW